MFVPYSHLKRYFSLRRWSLCYCCNSKFASWYVLLSQENKATLTQKLSTLYSKKLLYVYLISNITKYSSLHFCGFFQTSGLLLIFIISLSYFLNVLFVIIRWIEETTKICSKDLLERMIIFLKKNLNRKYLRKENVTVISIQEQSFQYQSVIRTAIPIRYDI